MAGDLIVQEARDYRRAEDANHVFFCTISWRCGRSSPFDDEV